MGVTKEQITFEREKDTKNTVRFAEVGEREEHKVGTLYIKKTLDADLGNPDALKVTIEKG